MGLVIIPHQSVLLSKKQLKSGHCIMWVDKVMNNVVQRIPET